MTTTPLAHPSQRKPKDGIFWILLVIGCVLHVASVLAIRAMDPGLSPMPSLLDLNQGGHAPLWSVLLLIPGLAILFVALLLVRRQMDELEKRLLTESIAAGAVIGMVFAMAMSMVGYGVEMPFGLLRFVAGGRLAVLVAYVAGQIWYLAAAHRLGAK